MPSRYDPATQTMYTTVVWKRASGEVLSASKEMTVDTGAQGVTTINFENAKAKSLVIDNITKINVAGGGTAVAMRVIDTCMDVDTEKVGGGDPQTLECCGPIWIMNKTQLLGTDQMSRIHAMPWWETHVPGSTDARLERR